MNQEAPPVKRLVIVAHAPSANTQAMLAGLIDGARAGSGQSVEGRVDVRIKAPLEAGPQDIADADAVILATPENLGYMSGALKDFFDRIYYPCLERTRGMPYALVVRAGQSAGAGSCRAVAAIVSGLGWRAMQDPLVCSGPFNDSFVNDCRDLGQAVAEGLALGIF